MEGAEKLKLSWKTPAHYKGHSHILQYYGRSYANSKAPAPGWTPKQVKGKITAVNFKAENLLSSVLLTSKEMIVRQKPINRCGVEGGWSHYLIYKSGPCIEDRYNLGSACREVEFV